MSNEFEDNNTIGRDLIILARLLNENGLCHDVSALDNAGQTCAYISSEENWYYSLDKISFRIDEVGSRIPHDSYDLSASLSMDVVGGDIVEGKLYDPLEKLCFDLELEGFRDNPDRQDFDSLYASWHLDRHLYDPEDGKTKYSHPLYHFCFGGNGMEDKSDVFGDCLILPSPRFSYPPMDAILGIDFILQNFLNKNSIAKISEDPEYIQIVKRAQERILKPYFLSIASFWNEKIFNNQANFMTTTSEFSGKMLYPLFY